MARIIVCLHCKQERHHEARGLCHTCYARLKRNGRLQEFPKVGKPKRKSSNCIDCGRYSLIEAKGLCKNCYARRTYHRNKGNGRIVTCLFCGEKKKHQAKGMCKACYCRAWRNSGVPIKKRRRKRKKGKCVECGESGEIRARDRCKRCYSAWHRRNNRELYKGYDEKYRKRPEYKKKALECKRKRRSRKKGLLATLTEEEWVATLESYDHACAYCGAKNVELHREHWIPLVKGGGYTADNIVPACRTCNCKKGTMTGDEFKKGAQ